MPLLKPESSNTRLHRRFWVLLFVGACLMLAALIVPGESLAFDSEPVEDFGVGWTILQADGTLADTPLTLPTILAGKKPVRIAKEIPQDIMYPAVLAFRSAHQKVRLYCGQELLYSFGYDEPPLLGKSPGSAWNIVRLPQEAQGQQLVLELDSPYPSYQGRMEGIYVGSKVALIFWLLRSYGFSFLITLMIFVVAVATLIVDFLVIRKDATVGKETFFLGLFALFVSLWLFGEGRLTQFFGISPAVNTCAVFLSMLATPIPLVEYIACGRSAASKKLLNIVSRALSFIFVGCVALQLFGILDFIEQMVFIHTCLLVTCLVMLYAVIMDMVRHPSAEVTRLIISMAVLAVCFIAETAGIYLRINSVGNMMRLGVLVFIAMQAQAAFQKALHMMQMSCLASVDALTGCLNRTAYAQRITELKEQHNVGIVVADINNLKIINDTYGHDTGDDAIIQCGKCFAEAFQSGGNCFRIGGDEFVMLGKNITLEQLKDMSVCFHAVTERQKKLTEHPFSVAYGYAVYNYGCGESLSDAVARADKCMYTNKRMTSLEKIEATQG